MQPTLLILVFVHIKPHTMPSSAVQGTDWKNSEESSLKDFQRQWSLRMRHECEKNPGRGMGKNPTEIFLGS